MTGDATEVPRVLRRLRRQRQAQRVSQIPRLVFELLDEIAPVHGIEDDVDRRLARYAALDPTLLTALGGNRFPPEPVYLVRGKR